MSEPNHHNNVSLNLNVRGLGRSATVAINERSNEMIQAGQRVYKLGLGQSPFPVPEPVVEALQANAHQKDYLPVQGLRELREAVAQFHLQNDDIQADPDMVLIGPGSKELMFLLQLSYYGDLVIPTPSWVSYQPQAQVIGRQVRHLPTTFEDGWRLHPEALEELCVSDPERPRIVVLNYPGNPDGSTYTHIELEQLAEVARKYGVVLLSDEIYGKLDFSGKHVSIARFYPEGTIISSGLSKWCGAGGWRLGTFTFPRSLRWLMNAMADVASETFTSTSAPIQYAAVTAFHGSYEIERYLAHSRRILSFIGKYCAERLRRAGARVVEPKGAFYLFPDFSPVVEKFHAHGIHTSTALCSAALDATGVAFLPGVVFGRPVEELTARIAYVNFDGARALARSETVPLDQPLCDADLERCCHGPLKAVDLLCEWVESL